MRPGDERHRGTSCEGPQPADTCLYSERKTIATIHGVHYTRLAQMRGRRSREDGREEGNQRMKHGRDTHPTNMRLYALSHNVCEVDMVLSNHGKVLNDGSGVNGEFGQLRQVVSPERLRVSEVWLGLRWRRRVLVCSRWGDGLSVSHRRRICDLAVGLTLRIQRHRARRLMQPKTDRKLRSRWMRSQC